jgi:hypothetical protein
MWKERRNKAAKSQRIEMCSPVSRFLLLLLAIFIMLQQG